MCVPRAKLTLIPGACERREPTRLEPDQSASRFDDIDGMHMTICRSPLSLRNGGDDLLIVTRGRLFNLRTGDAIPLHRSHGKRRRFKTLRAFLVLLNVAADG
jgi:hypothetical protein